MRLTGRGLSFALSGSTNSRNGPTGLIENYFGVLQARWNLEIADLGFLSSELGGGLQASGRLSGAPSSLAADADLSSTLSIRGASPGRLSAVVRAKGLPSAPSGTVAVHGTLDGAPLVIDAAVERDARNGAQALIRTADWNSVHLEGRMSLERSAADGRGQVRFRVGQLGDLAHLLGVHLQGSLEGDASIVPARGRSRASFDVVGRDLAAGPLSGGARLSGEGPLDSLTVKFDAQLPDLYGAAASLSSTAVWNIDARELTVANGIAAYRGQEFKLLAPARVSYANGLSVDRLQTRCAGRGVQNRRSADAGSRCARIAAPARAAARQCVHARPARRRRHGGRGAFCMELYRRRAAMIRLNARGIRFASDAAAGLPALDLRANAALSGDSAAIDARFSAGSASTLTVSGAVPLHDGRWISRSSATWTSP